MKKSGDPNDIHKLTYEDLKSGLVILWSFSSVLICNKKEADRIVQSASGLLLSTVVRITPGQSDKSPVEQS